MRTRTIYAAQSEAALACERDALSHRDGKPYQFTERRKRKERQWTVFERELLRRMDERDAVIPAAKDAEQKHMAWAVCPKKDSEQIHADWDASMWDLRLALYPVEAE